MAWSQNIIWLVVSTPLENMKVSWDAYSQYVENEKSCSKPPTSNSNDSGWFYGFIMMVSIMWVEIHDNYSN